MPPKTTHDSETPAHGRQVISVCAFVHHDFDGAKKLFLPRRAGAKKFLPGLFELPGGHIDFGEELIDGLKREIREEFGMEISVGDPFAAFTYQNLVKGSHTVEVVYFARFTGPIDRITLNPEDHSEYGWFTAEDVVARKNDMIPQEGVRHGQEEDPEYLTMLRGFELLKGKEFSFG